MNFDHNLFVAKEVINFDYNLFIAKEVINFHHNLFMGGLDVGSLFKESFGSFEYVGSFFIYLYETIKNAVDDFFF